MAITLKTGKLIGASMLREEDRKEANLILISKGGQTIKLPLAGIRTTGRVTQGVILTKIRGADDVLIRASVVKSNEEEEL